MVNRINNNLPPFLVKSEDVSKNNLFTVSNVNQGVKLSSYAYTDSTGTLDTILVSILRRFFYNDSSLASDINILNIGKFLSDSTGVITDILNYDFSKRFIEGTDPSTDQFVYSALKAILDSASPIDFINFNFNKTLNDNITVSERLSLSKSKLVDSSVTSALDLLGIDDGITYGLSKVFNDSINVSDLFTSLYAVGRQPLDSSSISDVNTISFDKVNFDSSTISEDHIYTLDKILNDSSFISELLANSLTKPFSDSEEATDLISLESHKVFFDSIESPTDLINTLAVVKNLNDSLNPSEILNYNIDKIITSEVLSPIEILFRNFSKSLTDSSFATDLSQLNLNKPNFADDSVNISDTGLISVQDYFLEIYVSDLQPYVEKSNTTF